MQCECNGGQRCKTNNYLKYTVAPCSSNHNHMISDKWTFLTESHIVNGFKRKHCDNDDCNTWSVIPSVNKHITISDMCQVCSVPTCSASNRSKRVTDERVDVSGHASWTAAPCSPNSTDGHWLTDWVLDSQPDSLKTRQDNLDTNYYRLHEYVPDSMKIRQNNC